MTKIPTPSKELFQAINDAFICEAWVKVVRPIVTDIQKKALAAGQYPSDKEHRLAGPILDPKQAYLMTDENFLKYMAVCNEGYQAAKLHQETPEHCPLLVAENLLVQADNVILKLARQLHQTGDAAKLDPTMLYGDNRKKYLDLTKRFICSHPQYKKPDISWMKPDVNFKEVHTASKVDISKSK